MKKILIPILCSTLIGAFLGFYLFKEYDSNVLVKPVFNFTQDKVYFLQLGAYSTLDKAKEASKDFTNYLYIVEDNNYHVYIAITYSMDNANKLKTLFKEKGYNIYIKEKYISNSDFINMLKQYDEVITKSNEYEAILKVNEKVLLEYKDVINSENKIDSQT